MPRKATLSRQSKANTVLIHVLLKRLMLFACICIGAIVAFRALALFRDWPEREWLGIEPYRLLLTTNSTKEQSKELFLIEYAPTPPQLIFIKIPADVRFSAGSYGKYDLEGLLSLGEIEQVGEKLLLDAISLELGMSIDGFVTLDTHISSETKPLAMANRLISATLNPARDMQEVNKIDLLKVALNIRQQTITSVFLDITEANMFDEQTEVDGTTVRYVNQLLLDNKLKSVRTFQSEILQAEPMVIENTTSVPGQARQWKRVLDAQGFDIVRLADSIDELENTQVMVNNESILETELFSVLVHTLGESTSITITDTSIYRSPIVVRIGKN